MRFVEQTHRHQEQAAARGQYGRQLMLNIGLLDGNLSGVAGGCHGMLHFKLGDQLGAVVDAVLQANHKTTQIKLRLV